MTKFQLARPGGPWEYPSYGLTATDGAILDGTLSTPALTVAPDAFWAVYGGGSAETGVARWGPSWYHTETAEPANGSALVYNAQTNTYEPSDAALSATIAAATAPGVTVACIGDSLSERNGPKYGASVEGVSAYYPQTSWLQLAIIRSGQRVIMPSEDYNLAVSGKTAAEVLSEQVPILLALDPPPNIVTVLAGTNSIAGQTSAQIITTLTAIYDALIEAGCRVIACTIPPASSYNTSGLKLKVYEVNRFIKSRYRGVAAADFYSVLTGGAGDAATQITNTLVDESGTFVHQSPKGAALMGRELARLLESLYPPFDPFPGPGDPANLFGTDTFMVGTAGAAGTGVTGSVATGWYIADAGPGTLTCAVSKVARTDGKPGEWQQIAFTDGSLRMLQETTATTGFTVGDSIYGLIEFETDANADTSTKQIEAFIVSAGSTNNAGVLLDTAGFDGTEVALTTLPRAGILRTPLMTVGTGTTSLDLWLRIWDGDGGTFRIGRMSLVKA